MFDVFLFLIVFLNFKKCVLDSDGYGGGFGGNWGGIRMGGGCPCGNCS